MTYRSKPDIESADRPALEIEITPEMIEAGANAVGSHLKGLLHAEEEVELILEAALAAAGIKSVGK